MWVALAIVAHQAALIVSREDQLLFDVVVSALIYLGLVKISANAARVWLCAGGALAGALFLGGTGLSIIGLFQDGWNVFGLMLWATPVFAAPGLLVGFWVVYRGPSPLKLLKGRCTDRCSLSFGGLGRQHADLLFDFLGDFVPDLLAAKIAFERKLRRLPSDFSVGTYAVTCLAKTRIHNNCIITCRPHKKPRPQKWMHQKSK